MKTRTLILTALLAALTALGAFLKIPTPMAPVTLQFFFTCMAGILLGPKYGALSQAVYVALGLFGLPIFTAGGGPPYVLQPTFGFLLGLIPAAAVTGGLARRLGTGFPALLIACAAGLAALYLTGLPYLHAVMTAHLARDWSLRQTVVGGMLAFLPGDAAKLAAAAALGRRVAPRLIRGATREGGF